MFGAVRRNLAAVAAVIVFLGGGALAAMAATGNGPLGPKHAYRHAHGTTPSGALASAAVYLGISRAQLRRELSSGQTLAGLASATSGKSEAGLIAVLEQTTQKQLAQRAAHVDQHVQAEVKRPYGPRGLARGALPNARTYLGLSQTQLRGDRHSGMTLAQVANATPGKSEAGLIEALVNARSEALATAVAAGTLSKDQQQAREAKLTKRVTKLVNRKPSPSRRRHQRR